jgi:hypothetical protein
LPLVSGGADCAFAGVGATMAPVAIAAEERLSRAVNDVRLDSLDCAFAGVGATRVPVAVASEKILGYHGRTTSVSSGTACSRAKGPRWSRSPSPPISGRVWTAGDLRGPVVSSPLVSGCADCAFAGFGATMVPVAVVAEERLSRADDVRLDCLDGG